MKKDFLIVGLIWMLIVLPVISNPTRLRRQNEVSTNPTLNSVVLLEIDYVQTELWVDVKIPGRYSIIVIGPNGDVHKTIIMAKSPSQQILELNTIERGEYRVFVASSDGDKCQGSFHVEAPSLRLE